MSGFAYNLKLSTAITPVAVVYNQESAGKVGKVLGVIAAVVIPFAAPAIFGAIAGSGFLGSAIAGAAASGGFLGAVTGIVGSAVVGGIMNAGVALATGGDLGQAFGRGAMMGAVGGLGRGLTGLGRTASAATSTGANVAGAAINPTVPGVSLTGAAAINPVVPGLNLAGTTSAASSTGGIMSAINNIFSGGGINRIGAALANALVNGESQQNIDALVAQQQAALQSLNAQEQAAYAQRMQAAQQILADADRQNPEWLARIRMADVAGIMNREHDEAQRNIMVGQGGSLRRGQYKAYERSGKLAIGRAKAGAWGSGYKDGVAMQSAMRAQGAGLMTGPSYAGWQAGLDLEGARVNAKNAHNQNTIAGFTQAVFGTNYNPAPSGDPSEEDNNDQTGIFGQWPRG